MTARVTVVGLGPGGPASCTPAASARLAAATDVVGYTTYIDRLPESGAVRHATDNRQEAERARFAFELAATGRDVVVVSSGDPGVFAMATAVIEELHRGGHRVDVEVLPGVTAATAAAAVRGAVLGHDFCVVSLSDVLKPFDVIEHRLDAAASADFVLALYNPRSAVRPWQFERATEIIGRHRSPTTPVVVARAVGDADESTAVTTLEAIDAETVDMRTIVIVGSSKTVRFADAGGRDWVYTPRRYP